MNKTTNQYINQLNLDPKREAAVRKLVEGAGGVSDSTPLVESLIGNELIPIKQDGENKAVSVEQIKNNVLALPSKYEFVDLGLPSGTKWATNNIGAENPEDAGLYFAWGETEGYEGITDEKQFNWSDYKLCGGSSSTLTKYNNNSSYGTVDTLITLEQVDDAAYVSDKTCRMPTKADLEELIANTTSTWEMLNNVYGRRFTSKVDTSKSIFVPAAGYCSGGSVLRVGSFGYLWSSSLDESNSRSAWSLFFNSGNVYVDYYGFRFNGFTVRPVQAPNTPPTTINLKELQDKVDNIEIQAKDAKEVYQLDINNYSTPEDFNNLKEAIQNNNIIQLTSSYGHEIATIANYDEESDIIIINVNILVPAPPSYKDVGIQPFQYLLRPDGTKTILNQAVVTLNTTGEGTKFLADDGQYKEVSSGSEPVKIDISSIVFKAFGDEIIGGPVSIDEDTYLNIVTIPTIFYFDAYDSNFKKFASYYIPYTVSGEGNGDKITFSIPHSEGIKKIVCNISKTEITYVSSDF